MSEVRIGIIGLGNMGKGHARTILDGKVPRLKLTAVCDDDASKAALFPEVPFFATSDEVIKSGTVDAIFVVTPHYSHTTIGIAALQAGLHVLVEKPISVHKADCEKLIAAHTSADQVFAAMFNQRTDPSYIKLKHLLTTGELGELRRVNWIITNWFRTAAYYASGGWRATWAGEGGGVLLNQCPHQLDLWQWLFGTPKTLRAFCKVGRYHDIEVEDDVTAYMEYEDGTTGVFITSTGEAPGTNRLEVVGERGRVVIENGKFLFTRNEVPMTEFSNTTEGGFTTPGIWNIEIPISGGIGGQHTEIMKNFTAAILDKTPLIAPAKEGTASIELANAMLYSSFNDQTVEFPLDAAAYECWLKKKIETSTFEKKTVVKATADDFNKSFAK